MSLMLWTPFQASLFVLTSQGPTTIGTPYSFQIDAAYSQVQYEIDSNLGPMDLGSTASGSLSGELALVLLSGPQSISEAQFDGGPCSIHPDLFGIVPNANPGAPPLVQVTLGSLLIALHSAPFELDPHGNFRAQTACEITQGSLEVSFLGAPALGAPLAGFVSEEAPTRGKLWIDASGIHVERDLDSTILVDEPSLNLYLRVRIHGVLRGDMSFPSALSFCPALPNSTGLPAELQFHGTPSFSRNDGQLLVAHCPPDTIGMFLVGDQRDRTPFGNGTLCVGGQLLRLQAIGIDANGFGMQALDLQAPPAAGQIVAGSHWGFQFAYRDQAAGGAGFGTSDALEIEIVP